MPYSIKKAKGKDGYYVYGEDKKRHSKKPMSLEMAKKQMTALNIAHAKKMGVKVAPPKKQKTLIVHSEPEKTGVHHTSKILEKAVELANMRGKEGIHSPAGVLAPLVSETTGGGSGLANDAHWVSAVKSGGRTVKAKHEAKETPMEEKKEHMSMPMGGKMTLAEKRKCYVEWYDEGKMPKEVEKSHRAGYSKFYKEMKEGKKPKWMKE